MGLKEKHARLLNELTSKMIARSQKAECFITGLKDFKREDNGVNLAHCLATYGLSEALEAIITLDKKVMSDIDDSGKAASTYFFPRIRLLFADSTKKN